MEDIIIDKRHWMKLILMKKSLNNSKKIDSYLCVLSCSVFVFEATPVFVLRADIVLVSERKLYLFGAAEGLICISSPRSSGWNQK